MIPNARKCHFISFGKNVENEIFVFNGTVMNNKKVEKF